MKIIWNKCENNVKVPNHMIFIFISYYFHIFFTFLGPGARARARPRARGSSPPTPRGTPAAPGPGPGPGPGPWAQKCEKHMKIIWNKYENNVIWHFHIIFTFISYYFHIIFTFVFHIIFILFSYFREINEIWPVYTRCFLQAYCYVTSVGNLSCHETFCNMWISVGLVLD